MKNMAHLCMGLLLWCTAQADANEDSGRTNVVLVGATGNLAQKYLFQAFFEQSMTQPDLHVYPAARKAPDVGQPLVNNILSYNVSCTGQLCGNSMFSFRDRVHDYAQLKKEEHWAMLGDELAAQNGAQKEKGRLIYLSIPPRAYAAAAQAIDKYLRPKDGWLRVIFEKPFGADSASAKALAQSLATYLAEDEIFRVDHYLGKAGVQAVLGFRRAQVAAGDNSWEDLLTQEHVARVEVAMTETEDCAGRTDFYNQYGVIRDVLQNHLTEMAVLIGMDLTTEGDDESFGAAKLSFLEAVHPPDAHEAVVGQYEDYRDHVRADIAQWGSPEDLEAYDESPSVRTPTFAAAELLVKNDRWNGVPFVLLSGKQLLKREAYVRVVFKNGATLLFQVQGGGTFIETTGDLPSFRAPVITSEAHGSGDGWQFDTERKVTLADQHPAYWVVVDRALAGDRSFFIATDPLLRSWDIWTPLLQEYHSHREVSLHIYTPTSPVTEKHLVDPGELLRTIEQNKDLVEFISKSHANGHDHHPEL